MWWLTVSLFLLGPLVAMLFGVWILGAVIFYAGAISLGVSSLRAVDLVDSDRLLAWVVIGLGVLSGLAGVLIYAFT
jgi:hypothetical protein